MGEIADGLVNGDFDMYTGEYLGPGGGFPRTNKKLHKSRNFTMNGQVAIEGVQKWLFHKLGARRQAVIEIVNEYQPGDGTLKQKCLEIQKDFKKFTQWVYSKIKENNK